MPGRIQQSCHLAGTPERAGYGFYRHAEAAIGLPTLRGDAFQGGQHLSQGQVPRTGSRQFVQKPSSLTAAYRHTHTPTSQQDTRGRACARRDAGAANSRPAELMASKQLRSGRSAADAIKPLAPPWRMTYGTAVFPSRAAWPSRPCTGGMARGRLPHTRVRVITNSSACRACRSRRSRRHRSSRCSRCRQTSSRSG